MILHVLTADSGKWDELEVTGSPPLGTNPTYSAVSGKIFVFGGIFDGVPTNSLYMLDIGEVLKCYDEVLLGLTL